VILGVTIAFFQTMRESASIGSQVAALTAIAVLAILGGSYFHNNYLVWIIPLCAAGMDQLLAPPRSGKTHLNDSPHA
jgi:hypothetical protein